MECVSARLVVHLPDGGDRVEYLHEGRTDVGRAADASIRFTLPEVSAHHAELRWDGRQLLMRDLASTNGTTVNGRQVSAWTELTDGDRIRWGPVAADVVLGRPEHPAVSGAFPDRGDTVVAPLRQVTSPQPGANARPSARRVFISHASEDRRLAREVAAILRRQGWEPWIDESDIRGGGPWAASIQQALRSSSVVVLLITADSVSKEWVLDEIQAARNLRVPIIPAVLEFVRLPDELQFMLQRTETVDVSALTTFSSDDQQQRNAAAARLDEAILNVLEHQGRLNPDRVRMRIGRVIQAIGIVLLIGGFAGFTTTAITEMPHLTSGSFPVGVLISFGGFFCGMILAGTGTALVRAARAKGL